MTNTSSIIWTKTTMRNLKEKISVENFIQKGSTGKVYKARRDSDGKAVAVKMGTWVKSRSRFPPEILNLVRLRKCGVKGVNPILDYAIDESEKTYQVVFEQKPMDLFDYVGEYKPPEPVARDIIRQTLFHLCEMDEKAGLMHMDIKPENALIDPDSIEVSLCDVENCIKTDKECVRIEYDIYTPDFIAPERINGRCFPRKSTVYSVGVMAYFLLHDNVPSTNIVFSRSTSRAAAYFIMQCLDPNPVTRPTAQELLLTEWMTM